MHGNGGGSIAGSHTQTLSVDSRIHGAVGDGGGCAGGGGVHNPGKPMAGQPPSLLQHTIVCDTGSKFVPGAVLPSSANAKGQVHLPAQPQMVSRHAHSPLQRQPQKRSSVMSAKPQPVVSDGAASQPRQKTKKRRKTKWQRPASQPIMRAAIWEVRFGGALIVETATRYGIPLRTLRRYRDISISGGRGCVHS